MSITLIPVRQFNMKYSHIHLLFFLSFLVLGLKERSIDSLVFDTLIPKPIVQRYLNLLMEHRRIILSGPSGTGKSFLAAKLAEYIISQMGQEVTEHNVASFNVDQNSSKVRGQILNDSQGLSDCHPLPCLVAFASVLYCTIECVLIRIPHF